MVVVSVDGCEEYEELAINLEALYSQRIQWRCGMCRSSVNEGATLWKKYMKNKWTYPSKLSPYKKTFFPITVGKTLIIQGGGISMKINLQLSDLWKGEGIQRRREVIRKQK